MDEMTFPELVWTCDGDGNWRQEQRFRIRYGEGWREFPVISADEIYTRIMADGQSLEKLDAALERITT